MMSPQQQQAATYDLVVGGHPCGTLSCVCPDNLCMELEVKW
jgi:hypothetical protein